MNWGSDFFFGIVNIYFILSIGGLGFWNLKIYEWIGRYTNELGFRFFLEDIRMNWKIYEWIGVQIFFGIINIYFIFCIGGLGFWNLKIYEWIGRYTNELGFRFFLEDIRMNWKIYEWIGRYTNELGFRFFFWNIYEWIGFYFGGSSENLKIKINKKK